MDPDFQNFTTPDTLTDDPNDTISNTKLKEILWNFPTIFQTIVLTIIVCGIIIGNGLVLLATFLTKSLHSSTHYFIVNLAVADFCVGISCLPFKAILTITGNWYFGQTYCTIWENLHFWLCSASILSVCAICVDRYVGVSFPLKHHQLMNKRNVTLISAGIWITALCLSAIPLAAWPEPTSPNEYECKVNQQLGHVLVASFGILYIPTVVMLVLYWKIYRITCEHFKNLREGFQGNNRNSKFRVNNSRASAVEPTIDDYSTNRTSGTYMTEISLSSTEDLSGKKKQASTNGKGHADVIMKKGAPRLPEQDRLTLNRNRQIRVAKRLAIVVGVFLFAYVPYFTVFLIRSLNPNTISKDVFTVLSWIRYFNSFLNPILYAAMMPVFANSMKNMVLCRFSG